MFKSCANQIRLPKLTQYLLCFSTLFFAAQALAVSDQELVDQFYPEKLAAESAKFKKAKPRQNAYVIADLDRTGKNDYIIAAYSNTLSGAVRILKKQGRTASLVSEPVLPAMRGAQPEIALIDLDGDKQPEIEISFTSARALKSDWYFKWINSQLQLFGPTWVNSSGQISTAVINSSAMDIDGDGVFEIIDGPHEPRPTPGESDVPTTVKVYSLLNGKYSYATTLFFDSTFVRKSGQPEAQSETFKVNLANAKYVLNVINGEFDGSHRVSSAEIILNGKTVVTSNNFNQKQAIISIPVTLSNNNELKVTLKSSPGSYIRVLVSSKR